MKATTHLPSTFDRIYAQVSWCPREVLGSLLELAVEIAREGREGHRIGTLFTLGRADAVMASSRSLILDPLAGHAPASTHIDDPNLRGTIKELAQLDGAFVVSEDGVVVAACRYLDASAVDTDLPLGLGSRHLAAASISKRLGIVGIVVSETAVVRVFHKGTLIAEIIPELWLLGYHGQTQLRGRVTAEHVQDLTIFTTDGSSQPGPAEPAAGPDLIDEALEESFPASDPPAWGPISGVKPRAKAS